MIAAIPLFIDELPITSCIIHQTYEVHVIGEGGTGCTCHGEPPDATPTIEADDLAIDLFSNKNLPVFCIICREIHKNNKCNKIRNKEGMGSLGQARIWSSVSHRSRAIKHNKPRSRAKKGDIAR